MREFLEVLAITFISIIQAIAVVILVMLIIAGISRLSGDGEFVGTNMNNETKEYVKVIDNSYGITKDGTRELLKSYKYKK
jgi:hypothetical protein|nr:MAG TPA: hypothetical protein [Caudoviricetes sp.]